MRSRERRPSARCGEPESYPLRIRSPEDWQAVRLPADDPRAVDAGGLIADDSRGQYQSNTCPVNRDHSDRAQIILSRIEALCGLGNLPGFIDSCRRDGVKTRKVRGLRKNCGTGNKVIVYRFAFRKVELDSRSDAYAV
jgi:hypothetical protein